MALRDRSRYYLCEFSYTTAAWKLLVRDPAFRDRVGLLRALLRHFDGCFAVIVFPCVEEEAVTVEPDGPDTPDEPPPPRPPDGPDPEKYVAFSAGRHIKTFLAFPGDEPATAFAMAVSQSGLVTDLTMTPLTPWRAAMAAMDRANAAQKVFPRGWS